MEENIYKAFAEVSDILNHSELEVQEKIPQKLKEMLEQYKDKNYIVHIDYSKNINEQKLLSETRQIIALIYRDYLCTEKEKEELVEKNNARLKEQYDIEKMFKAKSNETKYLVVKEEQKWYKKFFERILKIFKNT